MAGSRFAGDFGVVIGTAEYLRKKIDAGANLAGCSRKAARIRFRSNRSSHL